MSVTPRQQRCNYCKLGSVQRAARLHSASTHAHTPPGPPHLCVCTMLGAEASSSLGEQGASGGAPRFTRANTLTVGGSQLDGLLEERTPGHRGHPASRKGTQKSRALEEGTEGTASKEVRSWSLLKAEWQLWDTGTLKLIREVTTKVYTIKNHKGTYGPSRLTTDQTLTGDTRAGSHPSQSRMCSANFFFLLKGQMVFWALRAKNQNRLHEVGTHPGNHYNVTTEERIRLAHGCRKLGCHPLT